MSNPDADPDRSVRMCIRCGDAEAPEPSGYCTTCVVQVRVELSGGFRRLAEYLAAWAAFDDWCRSRDTRPVTE